jgi:hypothetical protein
MTHQGHSATTFTCGFTHPGGNDSGKLRRNGRQSGNTSPTRHIRIFRQKLVNRKLLIQAEGA